MTDKAAGSRDPYTAGFVSGMGRRMKASCILNRPAHPGPLVLVSHSFCSMSGETCVRACARMQQTKGAGSWGRSALYQRTGNWGELGTRSWSQRLFQEFRSWFSWKSRMKMPISRPHSSSFVSHSRVTRWICVEFSPHGMWGEGSVTGQRSEFTVGLGIFVPNGKCHKGCARVRRGCTWSKSGS